MTSKLDDAPQTEARRPVPDDGSAQRPRIVAVDAIKGIAIIGVLILHTVTTQFLVDTYGYFWIRQAVPVFLVLMGFMGANTRIFPLKEYVRRRLVRLGLPIAITWVVSLAIFMARADGRTLGAELFLGVLPASGPGNYYIAFLVQFALLLPLMRLVYRRSPLLLLVTSAILDVAFEIAAKHYGMSDLAYTHCVLRHIFTISLGMWMAAGGRIWPFLFVSVPYLWLETRGYRVPIFYNHWQTQSLLASGYAAALVALGLRIGGGAPRWLTHLGRASLHIFLVQMLWFGQVVVPVAALRSLPVLVACGVNIAVCVALGMAFFAADSAVITRFAPRR